jgi:hypothetical protein
MSVKKKRKGYKIVKVHGEAPKKPKEPKVYPPNVPKQW